MAIPYVEGTVDVFLQRAFLDNGIPLIGASLSFMIADLVDK